MTTTTGNYFSLVGSQLTGATQSRSVFDLIVKRHPILPHEQHTVLTEKAMDLMKGACLKAIVYGCIIGTFRTLL